MTEYKQYFRILEEPYCLREEVLTEIVDSDPIEDFVREYNSRMNYKDKKILELQNRVRELEDELRWYDTMVKNKSKLIKQQLKDVQDFILENLYLQEKYPDNKLELGLESLRELESEMFEALKQQKLNQKLEVSMSEYGKFKRILEDYDRRIINETDPIKKQELITLKTAFLWENKCMYRIYKRIHNIDEECLKEAVSNLTEKDIKDAIDNVVYDSKIKENKGLIEKIGKLLNE